MSRDKGKPAFCICENKDADQLVCAWFVSDLVGNPDDRFSRDAAQMIFRFFMWFQEIFTMKNVTICYRNL